MQLNTILILYLINHIKINYLWALLYYLEVIF